MAVVSPRRLLFNSGPQVLVLLIFTMSKSSQTSIPTKDMDSGCENVRNAYTAKGFNDNDVPNSIIPGDHLQVCSRAFTCCSKAMEVNLNEQSKADYNKVMVDKISLLRSTFITRTAKFDVFFMQLLDKAKQDLHNMFVRTYGLLYQQNSHIFTDLFHELRNYYKGKNLDLEDSLSGFFATLLQKMFQLLNTQHEFDKSYLECVSEHMDDLEPFGDVPKKLSVQVQRGFIAARTFVQGLAVGRDVVLEISKLKPSQSCGSATMKMLFCPYCRGLPTLKPCSKYCLNVLKGCLAYHSDLDSAWNKYIDALLKLAERLEGPFNIESVVDPIDVKISDAIMNFQENSESVSNKVFSGCGVPKKSKDRHKREAYQGQGYGWGPGTGGGGGGGGGGRRRSKVRPTTAAGTSLDRLVSDIRNKIEVVKGFWNNLPHQVCQDLAAPMTEETNCWNGITQAKYTAHMMNDGVVNQKNNPEVAVDYRQVNPTIDQQILKLKIITDKLRLAYNGRPVDYIDVDMVENEDNEASGSGSGSGSGDNGNIIIDTHIKFHQTTKAPREVPYRPGSGGTGQQNKENGATMVTCGPLTILALLAVLVYHLNGL